MSEKSLEGLRDFLCGTLSAGNILWLCQQLAEYAQKQQERELLKPYTMEELRAGILESEKQFSEGKFKTIEEVFQGFGEKFEVEEEMLEAV